MSDGTKTAYPHGTVNLMEHPRNLQKWMETMRTIYSYANQGHDFNHAYEKLTETWDPVEKLDFKHWMAFYQENNHKKYSQAMKIANLFNKIPVDNLKASLPKIEVPLPKNPILSEEQKKEEIKKKIRAIIGRLNAAEKLATDPEVQKELQKVLDIGIGKWLEELQWVKRQVQLAPMKNIASPILEDLIHKHANILENQGFSKAATLLHKIAQMAPPPGMEDPGMAPVPAQDSPGMDDPEGAMRELIEGMNNSFDSEEAQADDSEMEKEAALTVVAQAVPAPVPLPAPVDEVSLEPEPEGEVVTEEDPAPGSGSTANDAFEAALANIKVEDVIIKLEAVANIFRTREVSRQLAMIDLMMDRLGIASYFPSLAEASAKQLEGTQYALTRIEDILSKLRGSTETHPDDQFDLTGPGQRIEPIPQASIDNVQRNLMVEDSKEKAVKEQKKKEKLNPPPPPPSEVPEELQQPAQVTPPPAPLPVK